jgi:hypothetical protein
MLLTKSMIILEIFLKKMKLLFSNFEEERIHIARAIFVVYRHATIHMCNSHVHVLDANSSYLKLTEL